MIDLKLILKDPKNANEVGKSLNSALSQLVSEIGRKFADKRVNFIEFSITWPKITVNRPNSIIC